LIIRLAGRWQENFLMISETLVDSLSNIPIFSGFTEAECQQLYDAAQLLVFRPGEIVLHQGKVAQELWVLMEGKCEVFKHAEDGQPGQLPIVLATLEPHSNFGEMSFFDGAPHSASVRAQTSVKLLCFSRDKFDEMIRRESSMACKLAINTVNNLAERMRRMDEWVAELLTEHAQGPAVPELTRLREKLFNDWKL
jgi:CRP/FNR family cyclic AMP-dependent transcriptional regulator